MKGSHPANELEAMAAVLEARGPYRVLRKSSLEAQLQPPNGATGSPTGSAHQGPVRT